MTPQELRKRTKAFALDPFAGVPLPGAHVGASDELDGDQVVTPCGGCRQSILEAAQLSGNDVEMISSSGDGAQVDVRRISDLLPLGFGPDNLKDAGA